MKSVFVNASGFYAFLDRDDRFHAEALIPEIRNRGMDFGDIELRFA